ncbi:homoprotocatechuate degradation operon regulator HpaR [Chitinasiproducens palmae]|uniref:Homoprotocatechuate degradation operon regulator, HpaR n=1 Tax=Chitinasiproducens palmae TaxID=1770053 RepID=A0A1H2PL54_9BURK|nr:homoprotocatechuate degradation operon regulator HpaR [Chitinasiproducens palmae]SDV46361.1 homoprotocatechuate degradation operon regulator, HpaR [Chitinasiproducens palmae]
MTPAFKHRNLPHLLLLAREQFMAFFRPILREHGVTEQQWRVMRVLAGSGPLEPNQLALACTILSPSLTRMLVAMESAALITRTRSEVDHRRQIIALTDKSRAMIARMEPIIEQQYKDLEARLGETLIGELYGALDAAMGRLADGSAPAGDDGLGLDGDSDATAAIALDGFDTRKLGATN